MAFGFTFGLIYLCQELISFFFCSLSSLHIFYLHDEEDYLLQWLYIDQLHIIDKNCYFSLDRTSKFLRYCTFIQANILWQHKWIMIEKKCLRQHSYYRVLSNAKKNQIVKRYFIVCKRWCFLIKNEVIIIFYKKKEILFKWCVT